MTAVLHRDPDEITAESVRDAAYKWQAAGFAVLPVAENGEKKPDVLRWTNFQHEQPTIQHMRRWFDGTGRTGVGIITGAISGNVEMFELEGRAIKEGARQRLVPALKAAGVFDVWQRLVRGYTEHSPSGGIHFIYRLDGHEVPGNVKIASRPKEPQEYTKSDHELLKRKPNSVIPYVLAETRGEGGFVVIAPSHGKVHETGEPWLPSTAGRAGEIATITWDERTALFAVVHAVLDTMPEVEPPKPRKPAQPTSDGSERPGDDYARRTSWADLLEPHGWRFIWQRGDMDFWRRPGDDKRIGWSARTGGTHDGLWVWSTSTVFPTEQSITKFRAYSILEHNGNDPQAAAQLRRDGYGGERERPAPPTVVPEATVVQERKPPAAVAGPAWPVLSRDAMHGLAGDFVALWDPHTEAYPPAVLHLFLATAGCWLGGGYYVSGGNTRHTPKVWPLLAGDSSTGAKGTAVSVVRSFWTKFNSTSFQTASGLSTGEGLIKAVRDASGDDPSAQGFEDGVQDKRLWVDAPEFAGVLDKSRREGNSLSATLREAYDDQVLQSMTSGSPLKSTGSHIVITPQITPAELVTKLSSTDVANGLANRFMLVCTRMSKTLPEGSAPTSSELQAFGDRLHAVRTSLFKATSGQAELRRDDAGRKLWIAEYHRRFEDRRKDESESPVKSLLARWHANTARMSLTYALLDSQLTIGEPHVRAALAAWDYVEDSTRYVFGSEAGDRDLGRLMEYVNEREDGRSRKEISVELFQRHKTKRELDALIDKLMARGDYETHPVCGPAGGRPATFYRRSRG